MTLLEKIKYLCNIHDVTIYRLEKDCDFSMGSIKKWETQEPSAIKIAKVADFFNISVDYLLGRTNDTSPPVNLISRDNSGIIIAGTNGNISIGSQQSTKCKECEKLKKQLASIKKFLD